MDSHNPTDPDFDIESLARETDTPVATVQEIYKAEHAKLDRRQESKSLSPSSFIGASRSCCNHDARPIVCAVQRLEIDSAASRRASSTESVISYSR